MLCALVSSAWIDLMPLPRGLDRVLRRLDTGGQTA
jgi:hypothetical protein